jgi:heme A synthase
MIKTYVYLFAAFLISLSGTFINYGLVVYGVYPQMIGFFIELILIFVLVLTVLHAIFRIYKVASFRWKLIHSAIILALSIVAGALTLKVHIPISVKLYHGILNCALCP